MADSDNSEDSGDSGDSGEESPQLVGRVLGSLPGMLRMLGLGLGIFVVLVASQVAVPRLNAWLEERALQAETAAAQQDSELAEQDVAEAEIDLSDLDPPIYQSLDPAFVVSVSDAAGEPHFLQVSIQLMARDAADIERIEQYLPAIRNDFLILISSQNFEGLRDATGQNGLRQLLLEEARAVLERNTGEPSIDELYFTNLVLQ